MIREVFFIPCMIGETQFSNALCDLGASMDLMPFSLFEKLGVGDVKPTTISLQLADRSIVYPRGVIEDVLIKVEHFIFPVDFVVLDMEEDRNIPLILGRSFLRTARTIIDVYEGKLIMRLGDEQIEFNFVNSMRYPPDVDCCWMIEEIEDFVKDFEDTEFNDDDPLKKCLTDSIMEEGEVESEGVKEMVRDLKSLPNYEKESSLVLKREDEVEEEKPKLELKQLPNHLRYFFS